MPTPIPGHAIVALVLLMTAPAEAAPRRGVVRDFCTGSPDLCVVVCRTSSDCEGLISTGFSCEQRSGKLVVAEGTGEDRLIVTVYADAFAFCYYPSQGFDPSDLPDPSIDPVQQYRPERNDWHCELCGNRADQCLSRAERFFVLCYQHHKRIYERHCRSTMKQHGRPLGRHGRRIRGNHECEGLLIQGAGDEASDGYIQRTDRLQECRNELIRICKKDFRSSHPESTLANTIPLKVGDIGSFGFEAGFESSSIVKWGGSVGYLEACDRAQAPVIAQCALEQTKCEFDMNPNVLCEGAP